MYIANIDTAGVAVPPVISVAPGVASDDAAQALGLAPGTWREITDAEAKALRQPPLAKALAAARVAITARRKKAEYGGFDCIGLHWDSEEKDELRLNSVLTLMDTFSISEFPGWKISADTSIVLSQPLALQAAAAMMRHYNACFQVEAEKKAALAAAKQDNAAEVEAWLAVNLDTGWPG